MSIKDIWIWQRMVTPHMANLATSLAAMGINVTYVAECEISEDRKAQGWVSPDLPGVNLLYIPNRSEIKNLISNASTDSIHICQGMRGNGSISFAQSQISKKGLRQWVVMETVNELKWHKYIKRLEYRRIIHSISKNIDGILAIGHTTPSWLVSRGMQSNKIYPFTYFLPSCKPFYNVADRSIDKFVFLFVGQFIDIKRLDLLIDSLAELKTSNYELRVIGSGPLDDELRKHSEKLKGQVQWIGRKYIDEIPNEMAAADCLILPSAHDGWGVVVSEALMAGTPAICSDRCGVAGVVKSSNVGGVFKANNKADLVKHIEKIIVQGRLSIDEKNNIATWASCLTINAGADYLINILKHKYEGDAMPKPPWEI